MAESDALTEYRHLQEQLAVVRIATCNDSPEEDAILDQMDVAWRKLSDKDHATLKAEGPQCWPDEK